MDPIETDLTGTFIALTSDIVAAHVSYNNLAVSEVPVLISKVHAALAGLGETSVAKDARPDPAVSVRASVRKDHIVCLDCGEKMKMLKRHLSVQHRMTPDEYRQRWDLPGDYPIVAPNYADARRELAMKIGLGRKPQKTRGRKKSA